MAAISFSVTRILSINVLCFLGLAVCSASNLVLPPIGNISILTSKYVFFHDICPTSDQALAAQSLTASAHLPVTPFEYYIPGTIFRLRVSSSRQRLPSVVDSLTVFLDATHHNMMEIVTRDAEAIVEPSLTYICGGVEMVLEATHPDINVGNLAWMFEVGGPGFVSAFTNLSL